MPPAPPFPPPGIGVSTTVVGVLEGGGGGPTTASGSPPEPPPPLASGGAPPPDSVRSPLVDWAEQPMSPNANQQTRASPTRRADIFCSLTMRNPP
jgi:hypothetical protein